MKNELTKRDFLKVGTGACFGLSAYYKTTGTVTAQSIAWTTEVDGPVAGRGGITFADGTIYVQANRLYAIDATSGEILWDKTGVGNTPTVVDGRVIAGDRDRGPVSAYDTESGEEIWVYDTSAGVRTSPTVVDGIVYVGTDAGELHALDAYSGENIWSFSTGSGFGNQIESSPTVVGETVFFGSNNNNFYAVDTSSGEKIWQFETEGEIESSPTVVQETVFVGSNDNKFYALDSESGEKRWDIESDESFISSPTVADGTVFVGSTNELFAIEADSGEIQWSFDDGVISSPTVVSNTVFVGVGEQAERQPNSLYALDTDSGGISWTFSTDGPVFSSPTVVDGRIFFGSNDETVYAVDTMDVEDSSEGSRVMLGTLGHHDEWEYAGQIIDTPIEESTNDPGSEDSDTPPGSGGPVTTERILAVGGGAATLLGGYGLMRSLGEEEPVESKHPDEPPSDSDSPLQSDQPSISKDDQADKVNARIDDYLDTLSKDINTINDCLKKGEFDKALTDCQNARESGEVAHNLAESEAPNRREEIEEKLTHLNQLEEDINTERNAYQSFLRALQSVSDQLDQADSQLNSDPEAVQKLLEEAEKDLTEVDPQLNEHNFEVLNQKSKELQSRVGDIRDQVKQTQHSPQTNNRTVGGIPETIPTSPELSLPYTNIEKGDPLGSGGNADVYYATADTGDGTIELALKEPRMSGTIDTDTIEEMLSEAETWQQLDEHDHIVSVISYGSDPLPWIGMEYMDGGDITDRAGELPIEQTIWTALRTTEAVRHAHDRGVAHFDIKPANILFRTVEDAWDIPKVADWGLSKQLLNHSKSVDGMSPHYAAPEQFDTDQYGKTDNITDIYQLGAVFYELFTGQPPFEGQTFEVMKKIETETPTPPSEIANVPPAVDDILLKALAKEKNNRYEHVLYLRDDLRTLWNETK